MNVQVGTKPAGVDLIMYGPSDWFPTFYCFTVDDQGVKTPYDFTGFLGARMEIKSKVGATAQDTLSTGNGRLVLGGNLGTLQMRFSYANMDAYQFASSNYDLFLKDSTGNEMPFFFGEAVFTRGLTGQIT